MPTPTLFALEEFAEKYGGKYLIISKSCKSNWQKINPMFRFLKEIRLAIYTTNVIESLNFSLRKITKNPRHISIRRSRYQTFVARLAEYREKVDNANSELESGNESNGNNI